MNCLRFWMLKPLNAAKRPAQRFTCCTTKMMEDAPDGPEKRVPDENEGGDGVA